MNPSNPDVDFYFSKSKKWRAELEALRQIALGCPLTEVLKWGTPCYTHDNANIVLMHEFKEYCALLFFKGALLKDPKGILVQQTANTQSARQIRFTQLGEIKSMKALIESTIREAIDIEKAGLKVPLKKTAEFAMPPEFASQLKKNRALKTAFEALTPGRQRAYLLHFSAPVQPKTREARIEKCLPGIMGGKGLND